MFGRLFVDNFPTRFFCYLDIGYVLSFIGVVVVVFLSIGNLVVLSLKQNRSRTLVVAKSKL